MAMISLRLLEYCLEGSLYPSTLIAVEILKLLCIAYDVGPAVLLIIVRLGCQCFESGMPVMYIGTS